MWIRLKIGISYARKFLATITWNYLSWSNTLKPFLGIVEENHQNVLQLNREVLAENGVLKSTVKQASRLLKAKIQMCFRIALEGGTHSWRS